MEETAPPSRSIFSLSNIKSAFSETRAKVFLLLALLLALAGTGLFRKYYLKPVRALADIRYESHQGLMKLYDLQIAYHGANGAYANDLDSLLASSPDGEKLRVKLAAAMDINTLAVIGDEKRFRLEANILDPQRTSVKIRGPLNER